MQGNYFSSIQVLLSKYFLKLANWWPSEFQYYDCICLTVYRVCISTAAKKKWLVKLQDLSSFLHKTVQEFVKIVKEYF